MRSPKYFSRTAVGILLLTSLVCFDRSLYSPSLAQSNDTDAIRSLVGRIFELYQQKGLDRLISLWSEKSSLLAENKRALQSEFATYERIAVKGFDIRKTQIDGDKATLRVAAEMALTRAHMVKPVEKIEKKNRTIELVNEGGTWKVLKFTVSEEELAAAIIAAKTEEERKAVMEREPELITSDLADALIRQNGDEAVHQMGYQRGLAINQLAYKLAEQTGDQYVAATALMNAGHIHGWIGTPERSAELTLEYLRKSLKIGEEFGFKDVMARSLILSAVIYHFQLELSPAIEYYQKGLKLAEEVRDLELTVRAMNNMGAIYRSQGNLARALELLVKCLKMSESQLESGADWGRLSRALMNIASIFSIQYNYERALGYYQRAYEAAEKSEMLGDASAKWSKANVLAGTGDCLVRHGNYSSAMDRFQKALKLAEELEDGSIYSKDGFISMIKTSVGDLLAAEDHLPQAMAKYHEALQQAEKAGNESGMLQALSRLGWVYLLQEDYRQELIFAERTLKAAEQLDDYPSINSALVMIAQAQQKLGQPEEARQALARATDLAEQLREQAAGSALDRQRYFEDVVGAYEAMVDFQVDQKRFKEALSYTQRAKGGLLLGLLQHGGPNSDQSLLPAEREQEQQLSRKIVSLNRRLVAEKLKSQLDKALLAEFEERLKKARLDFESFQTTLYTTHPELKVQRGDVQPISFDQAAELIPNTRTALLDFIVTYNQVQLFVLTKDASNQATLNTYTVKIERKSLAEKVERFRSRLANKDFDFQKLSQELYGLLLKPAQEQLQNKTYLIISPDRVLWDLPFQVLQSPEGRYLIEDAAVSYAPSLSVLREMQLARKRRQSPATASILALGNPELGKQSVELAKFILMDAELGPLPEAGKQVVELGQLYGRTHSKVYTGPAAREEVVKQESARYRILHMATHGILNDVSPMYSHVMLSQAPGKSDEDGLLEAREIMNLKLNADLVVLSACETARGHASAGEGVIGLTWALFAAGCPTAVVSQWKVESSSTTDLMVEFHKRYKTRFESPKAAVSTAEALRQAALKLMKDPQYRHPFFWGGFVVVGDGQ